MFGAVKITGWEGSGSSERELYTKIALYSTEELNGVHVLSQTNSINGAAVAMVTKSVIPIHRRTFMKVHLYYIIDHFFEQSRFLNWLQIF